MADTTPPTEAELEALERTTLYYLSPSRIRGLCACIRALRTERDALAAQVAALRKRLEVMVREWTAIMGDESENSTPGDVLEKAQAVLDDTFQTATQHDEAVRQAEREACVERLSRIERNAMADPWSSAIRYAIAALKERP